MEGVRSWGFRFYVPPIGGGVPTPVPGRGSWCEQISARRLSQCLRVFPRSPHPGAARDARGRGASHPPPCSSAMLGPTPYAMLAPRLLQHRRLAAHIAHVRPPARAYVAGLHLDRLSLRTRRPSARACWPPVPQFVGLARPCWRRPSEPSSVTHVVSQNAGRGRDLTCERHRLRRVRVARALGGGARPRCSMVVRAPGAVI